MSSNLIWNDCFFLVIKVNILAIILLYFYQNAIKLKNTGRTRTLTSVYISENTCVTYVFKTVSWRILLFHFFPNFCFLLIHIRILSRFLRLFLYYRTEIAAFLIVTFLNKKRRMKFQFRSIVILSWVLE